MKMKSCIWMHLHILACVILLQASSCEKGEIPVVATSVPIYISITSVTSGGNIISDGGSEVTASGICWSLDKTPTLADSITIDGASLGSFTSNIAGLKSNTTYYVRAYATNMVGTAFGSEKTFTTYALEDVDGNLYHTVKIGTQEWMQENLKTTKYRDGSAIPNITSADDWANLFSGAYCDYNNDTTNVSTYGRLYNWYAVIDARNICPAGWHVPTDDEWDKLVTFLGGENIAGGKMKSMGSVDYGDGLWYSFNIGGTNESGFTGLPGGHRGDTNGNLPFKFTDLHSYGMWWGLNGNSSYAWFRYLIDANAKIQKSQNFSRNGKSIRCIKD